ncbi:MAG: OB-fold nucleic acid binding domain-containing protein, partial [Streptosporangiaceae bacterium]
LREYERPTPPDGATVQGHLRAAEVRPAKHSTMLACEVTDSTGDLTALFYGRSKIPGLMCGGKVRLRGQVGIKNDAPVMVNPAYELLVPGQSGDGE